jgi:DNA polymerase-1
LCPLGGLNVSTNIGGEWWGDPDWAGPTIMAIGINPGRQEDLEGRPFIGPSGQKLKYALTQAGVKRAFLTNAFGCLGEPDMEYARACAEYLDEEIERIKPQWIFAFGNVPLQRLTGHGRVTVLQGKEQWSARYQAWILPVAHPAAILRNMGQEPSWLADIMRYGRLIRGELQPPPSTPPVRVELVSYDSTLRGITALLETEPMMAYDFEANTMPWWHVDFRPWSIAFSFTGQEAVVVPIMHPETDIAWRRHVGKWLRMLRPLMSNGHPLARLVHNGVYDDLVWYRLTGYLPEPTWDTMIALQLLDENAPKSLKWAGRAHLGWPDWDINARKYHRLDDLYPYNGYDAAACFLLWERQEVMLNEDPWLSAYARTVEMPKLRALERMLARGIFVDRRTAAVLLRQAWQEREAADRAVPIANPASHPQVAHWLYQTLALPVLANGKKHPSTAEQIVNRLAQLYPEARLILDCRRPRKKISTYFRPLDKATKRSFDGRFHPDMRTTSVETGRLSGFLHTTPRDLSVRPIFSAPEGRVLLSADYRQIEARLCAWMAVGLPQAWDNVPKASMLWAFHEQQDIYRLFAALALRKHPSLITKQDRQEMGKVPVLAQLYGISWQGLKDYAWKSSQIDWSDNQARRLHTLFQRTFPEFPTWHRFEGIKLRNSGLARSPIGRLRRLPGAMTGNQEEIRSGINMPPQSLASDITQMAMILLDRAGARIVGNIHDALLIEAPAGTFLQQADAIARVMTVDAIEHLSGLGLRLPPGLIEVEISAGPWGLGEEVSLAPPH